MLTGLLLAFVSISMLMLSFHLIQYLGLRMRNEAAPKRDPHLGRKFVLHLFQHLGILLALSGFTISAIDICDNLLAPLKNKDGGSNNFRSGRGGIFSDSDTDDLLRNNTQTFQQPGAPPVTSAPPRNLWNKAQRFAVALILSGLLHSSVIFAILFLSTNNREFPAVARVFGIARLVGAGIILMGCTTTLILAVLQKESTDYDSLALVIGMMCVWGPTAIGHLIWMRWTMKPPADDPLREPLVHETEEAAPIVPAP